MMGFWVTTSEIGGLWVTEDSGSIMGGHWVRVGLKMGIFMAAHGASHSIECPPGNTTLCTNCNLTLVLSLHQPDITDSLRSHSNFNKLLNTFRNCQFLQMKISSSKFIYPSIPLDHENRKPSSTSTTNPDFLFWEIFFF